MLVMLVQLTCEVLIAEARKNSSPKAQRSGRSLPLKEWGSETKVKRRAEWYVPTVPELRRPRKEGQLSLGIQEQLEQHKGH